MEHQSKKLSENLEDYLEVIASLSAENGSARLTDIANAMSVKKPSVTSALNTLSERGLVVYERYKPVALTADGEILAQKVRRKHQLLSDFLIGTLGVNQSDADIAACKMEHALEDSI
jgi:DtxR family Mn-dependent transcriptional regulator